MTIGRGREKSGEIEESRERDVEGETCHMCIEREEKKSCAAIALDGKKKLIVFFNDLMGYIR